MIRGYLIGRMVAATIVLFFRLIMTAISLLVRLLERSIHMGVGAYRRRELERRHRVG